MSNVTTIKRLKHPFHIVDASPWPFTTAFGIFTFFVGFVMYMHFYNNGLSVLLLGLGTILVSMALWFRDVVREATFEGHHTAAVRDGIRLGMVLFIASEVMFFFAFFWAFFHSSLNPTPELGSVWPPVGIETIGPWGIPLLNTIILLTSGATVTWCHYSILAGYRKQAIQGLVATLVLAVVFTFLQKFEYDHAPFNISDSVYGATFYMTTGFHGFHVIVGTLFLAVALYRLVAHHFTRNIHLGFEAASWYWHFVDVVWLFLFLTVYWWGN